MTDDLDNLRPEVLEAVREIVLVAAGSRPDLQRLIAVIRAELLRLANELDSLKNLQSELAAQVVRVEKAGAELAALKARIVEAPMIDTFAGIRVGIGAKLTGNADGLLGHRVALVKVEE